MQKKPLIFGYWKIRGKGHILRMVMEYLHLPYQQVVYSTPQSFFNEKNQFAHLAQNLPYLKDGDDVIFDLMPALTYIIGKYAQQQLMGKTLKDKAIVDMFSWDMQYILKKLMCGNNQKLNQKQKQMCLQNMVTQQIQPMLSNYQKLIPQESVWFLNYFSILDLCMYEIKKYIERICPEKILSFPKMAIIAQNVMTIPEIKQLQNKQTMKQLCFLPIQMCKRTKKIC